MADDIAVHPDSSKDNDVIHIIVIVLAIEMAFLLAALMMLDKVFDPIIPIKPPSNT